jgi:hypothetical protein
MQAAAAQPAPGPDLPRIREALIDTPAIALPAPAMREGLIFRVTIHAPMPQKPMWEDWSNVPSYIRPNMPLYHYEFMQMVTPEQFRGGTMNTVGIPVGLLIEMLAKHTKTAHRKTEEEKARDEVRQALAEVLACRADPRSAGC